VFSKFRSSPAPPSAAADTAGGARRGVAFSLHLPNSATGGSNESLPDAAAGAEPADLPAAATAAATDSDLLDKIPVDERE